ncbi:MAG: Hpt domain-containing protein [Natronohydrobacter sp.]|jgi:HPt (histidine-containing phosphotransfer) domain-containing protein|nr:Hpt domain-containing protein [Natronohydrobacter sp.]
MINWARLAELYDDFGEDGIAEVVDIFLDEVGQAQHRLLAAQDAKTLREEFHFLKGAALNLGFDEISALCEEGEQRAAEGRDSAEQQAKLAVLLPRTCAVFASDWRRKMAG